MPRLFGQQISEKKIRMIKSVFHYRGVTVEQLLKELYTLEQPATDQHDTWTSTQANATYTALRDLITKKKLLQKDIMSDHRHFISLTPEGLEFANNLLDIPINHIGQGFRNDYGEFSYDRYRPPKSFRSHHLILVDFFQKIELIKKKHPDIKLDYRDNRYSSVKYLPAGAAPGSNNNKFHIYRPDGELLIDNRLFTLEIDTGQEYYEKLKQKFEGYNRYFHYLEHNGLPLPSAILFVTDAAATASSFQRRNSTIAKAFFSEMSYWFHRVNLISGTLSDIERIVLQEHMQPQRYKDLLNKLKFYVKGDAYKGTPLQTVNDKQGWPYDSVLFSITKNSQENKLFIYERLNGFETIPLGRIIEFGRWVNSKKREFDQLASINQIVPVFYYDSERPGSAALLKGMRASAITTKGSTDTYDEHLKSLFSEMCYLDLTADPIWHNAHWERIKSNPLMYF